MKVKKIKMTLTEFYDVLNSFDWYYDFSDDHRVWKRGESGKAKILAMITEGGKEFKDLYDGFVAHHFSGPSWNTDKAPKPERVE